MSNDGLSLTVIVPVYNEQFLVQHSLERLAVLTASPLLRRIKVVVVDDSSTDQTPIALKRFQESLKKASNSEKFEWVFVRHERQQGKGGAIRTALEYADTDLTAVHDADLEYHPRDLLRMIPLFLDEKASAVIGSRFLVSGFRRVLLFRHMLGNKLLTLLCNIVTDLNLTDVETCYKVVRTALLKSIPLESSDFRIEIELIMKLGKRGARIFEVPISYSGRTYLEGKKIGWKDGLLALWAVLRFAASDRIYSAGHNGGEILARLARASRFNRWMADALRPYLGERVLELGAGSGNLTVQLMPRSLYCATDINPFYLERLRELSQHRPYLSVQYTDINRKETFPAGQKFDTVVCLNLLEHVADDAAAVRNIRDVLEPGGRAIVLVPQGPYLYGSLDRVLGHYRRYRVQDFTALANEAGLEVHVLKAFNRSGVPAWWLNGKALRRTTFGLFQIKILNLLTPAFRRLDRWLPFPPLSLVGIFQKPTMTHAQCD